MCTFRTEELPFQRAYPGTYGYRIRAISIAAQKTSATPEVKGLLRNEGISSVSRMNGETHVSVRERDALPLSEFHLRNDMAVYSLPDEALFTFEGSGIETSWTLELPAIANPNGLDDILDILITFDLRAYYSPELYKQHIAATPKTLQRLIMISARKHQPKSLVDLQRGIGWCLHTSVTFKFDMAAIGLPPKESNRKVKNLMLFLASDNLPNVKAGLQSTLLPTAISFDFENRHAISNADPLVSSSKPSPLNAFVDQNVEQLFELTISKNDNPNVDFSKVTDVILGIEYAADY